MLNRPNPSPSLAMQEAQIKSRLIPADVIDVNDREAAMHAMQDATKREAILKHYREKYVTTYGVRTVEAARMIIQDKIIPFLDNQMSECKENQPEHIRYAVTKRRISAHNPESLTGFRSSLYNLEQFFETLCRIDLSQDENQIYHPLVVFTNQWLATSDDKMTFSPEKEKELHSHPERRQEWLNASKSAFISAFADDMCREYNETNDPLSANDSTACGPGFLGKLFLSLNRFNHAVIMPLPDNTLSFEPLKADIRNFIIEQLTVLPGYNESAKEQIKTGMFLYLSNCIIMQLKPSEMKLESEERIPYLQYRTILEDIQQNTFGLFNYLIAKNPSWSAPLVFLENDVGLLLALECEHLKMERDDANADSVMLKRLFHDYFYSIAVKNWQNTAKDLLTPAKVEYVQTIHQTLFELDTLYFILENESQRITLDSSYADLPDVKIKLIRYQNKYTHLKNKIDNLDSHFEVTFASYLTLIKNKKETLTSEANDFGVQLDITFNPSWKSTLPASVDKKLHYCQSLIELISLTLRTLETLPQARRVFPVNVTAHDWINNFIRVAIRKTVEGRYYHHTHEIQRLLDLMEKKIQQYHWRIEYLLDELNSSLFQLSDQRDEWNARVFLAPIFEKRWGMPLHREMVHQCSYTQLLSQLKCLLGHDRVDFLLSSPSLLLSKVKNEKEWLEDIDNVKTILIENFRSLDTAEKKAESIYLSINILICKTLKLNSLSYTNVNELKKICGYFLGDPIPQGLRIAFIPAKPELNGQIQGLLFLISCMIKSLSGARAYFEAGMIQIMSNDAANHLLTTANNPNLAICRLSLSQPNLLVKQSCVNGTWSSDLIGIKRYRFHSDGYDEIETDDLEHRKTQFNRCSINGYSLSFFDDIVYLRHCMNHVTWYSTRPEIMKPLEWDEKKEARFLADSTKKVLLDNLNSQTTAQQVQRTIGYMYFFQHRAQESHYVSVPLIQEAKNEDDDEQPGSSSSLLKRNNS